MCPAETLASRQTSTLLRMALLQSSFAWPCSPPLCNPFQPSLCICSSGARLLSTQFSPACVSVSLLLGCFQPLPAQLVYLFLWCLAAFHPFQPSLCVCSCSAQLLSYVCCCRSCYLRKGCCISLILLRLQEVTSWHSACSSCIPPPMSLATRKCLVDVGFVKAFRLLPTRSGPLLKVCVSCFGPCPPMF